MSSEKQRVTVKANRPTETDAFGSKVLIDGVQLRGVQEVNVVLNVNGRKHLKLIVFPDELELLTEGEARS